MIYRDGMAYYTKLVEVLWDQSMKYISFDDCGIAVSHMMMTDLSGCNDVSYSLPFW